MKKHALFCQLQKYDATFYIPKSKMNRIGEMVSGMFANDAAFGNREHSCIKF